MVAENGGVPISGVEPSWQPSVTLDVMTASQKAFNDTYAAFYRLNQGRAPSPTLLSTGWHTITPQITEDLLLGKANRKLSVATIAYYARLMMAGAWKRTGESIIIDTDGVLRDAYHRAWAAYLSGCSFDTFVVTGVEPDAEAMMYIGNGKSRSDADALEFGGLNGLSKVIASVVKVAVRYDLGYYEPHNRVKIHKMSPPEVYAYADARPSLHSAVHGVIAEFKACLSTLLPSKTDVTCYVGWRIYDLYGVDVMEEFFTELSSEEAEGVFLRLRAKLEADVDRQRRGYRAALDKRDVLAYLIKTFNAWRTDTPLRQMVLGTDETFPQLMAPTAEDDQGVVIDGGHRSWATVPVSGQADPTSVTL